MTRAIVVAGCGVVTPAGLGAGALVDALLANRCAIAEHDALVPGQRVRAAAVDDALLDPSVLREDRALALADAALRDLRGGARASSLLEQVDARRLGVIVGSTQGAITRWERQRAAMRAAAGDDAAGVRAEVSPPDSSEPLRRIAQRLDARGPCANTSMACASGTAALALGARWLLRGRCDAVVVGGVDALSCFVRQGFFALRALDPDTPRPFDAERAGLGLGEAAALLVLARAGDTAGIDPGDAGGGWLLGWGMSGDANHLTGPDREGRGVTRATARALDSAGVAPGDVAFVCAHGTATAYNDRMEAIGLVRALAPARPPVMSLKGAIGHSLAAAGAVEAAATLEALGRGVCPPTVGARRVDPEIDVDVVIGEPRPLGGRIGLSTSSGFGGINAAVVLEA